MKSAKEYIKLPVSSDGIAYLWDADSNMVADIHEDDGEEMLKACAAALNYANGLLPEEAARTSIETSGIKLPVKTGGSEGIEIIDAGGRTILRVRGWGRLQYLGNEEAVEAQETIAREFAEAINAFIEKP